MSDPGRIKADVKRRRKQTTALSRGRSVLIGDRPRSRQALAARLRERTAQLELAVRAGRELYEQQLREVERLRHELKAAGGAQAAGGGGRSSARPRHAEVKAAGEAIRLQKRELREEIERQRGFARRARELLEEASGEDARRQAGELLAVIEAGAAQAPAADRFLFIVGCPRSGTTAMVDLLNRDERIALGLERFKYLEGRLERRHFSRDYFLNPTPDETNVVRPKLYRRLGDRLDRGTVVYLGDKVLTHGDESIYEWLTQEFPGSRLLYMFRRLEGVASSFNRRAGDPEDVNWPDTHDYRRAVEVWNESLAALRSFSERFDAADRLLVVGYEQLFSGDTDSLRALYRFLDLELLPEVRSAFAEATRDWATRAAGATQLDEDARRYLDEHKDRELERVAAALAKPELLAR
jgi:hypothetical protein